MQIARNYLHRTIRRVFLLARIMPLPVVAPTGEDHTPSILFPFPVDRNSLSFHNFSSSRIIGAITIYGECVIGCVRWGQQQVRSRNLLYALRRIEISSIPYCMLNCC